MSWGHAGPLGFACKSRFALFRPVSPRGDTQFSRCPNRFWPPLEEWKYSCVLPGSVRLFVSGFAKPPNRQATSRTIGSMGLGGSNKSCGGNNDQSSFTYGTMLSVGCQAGFAIHRVHSFNDYDDYMCNTLQYTYNVKAAQSAGRTNGKHLAAKSASRETILGPQKGPEKCYAASLG